jgi:hypothetical protein
MAEQGQILVVTPGDRTEGPSTSGMDRQQAFATDDMWSGFVEATFQGNASFVGATFQGDAGFDGVRVLHLDDPDLNKRRVWPDGSTVRADPAEPARGTLVRAEQVEEPRTGLPQSDRPADSGLGPG